MLRISIKMKHAHIVASGSIGVICGELFRHYSAVEEIKREVDTLKTTVNEIVSENKFLTKEKSRLEKEVVNLQDERNKLIHELSKKWF